MCHTNPHQPSLLLVRVWRDTDSESLEKVAEQQKDVSANTKNRFPTTVKRPSLFFQCQLQLHITRRAYCDFVVWHSAVLHVERIHPVDQHLNLVEAAQFFRLCTLPELAGKWYTQSHTILPASELANVIDEDDPGTWCYCQESKGGDMIGSNNKNCTSNRSTSCLQMTAVPLGKWFCPFATQANGCKGQRRHFWTLHERIYFSLARHRIVNSEYLSFPPFCLD